MRAWNFLTLTAVLLVTGCTVRPQQTDTGFEGTWSRDGIIGGYHSTVSIVRREGRWLWRWKLDTDDGQWKVRCGWDGKCEEWVAGKPVGEYTFVVRMEEGEDFLTVECARRSLREGDASYSYVDELVLQPGGKSLRAYTMRLNDQTYTREATRVLELKKVSDLVADPPPGRSS